MKKGLRRRDFRLEMLLGLGKTAQVFLARAPGGEPVALKIPRREVKEDPALAERFAREVRLSMGLGHPHVVKGLAGYPYGEEAFLALEYFPDGSLEERLKRGPLDEEGAVRVLKGLGAALIYLRKLGIVHQDIKPANLFLDGHKVKLGDFGVAFTREEKPLDRAGSPFYMAPELFLGKTATPASDAYSYGVLAYELLTGRRPFYGETFEELRMAHLTHEPPMPSSLPRPVARALKGLLAKDPRARARVEDLLEALRQQEETPKPDKAKKKTSARRLRFFWRKP
jgi:serine/threonine-protein kinase